MFELTPEEAENCTLFSDRFFDDLDGIVEQYDPEDDPLANFDSFLVGEVFALVLRSKPQDGSLKEACREEVDEI